MIKRIIGELPVWMRPSHPLLRYRLDNQTDSMSTSARLVRAFFIIAALGVFLFLGYASASDLFERNPFDLPYSQLLFNLIFWPALVLQIGLQLTVLLMSINTIGEERRRQTWDALRTTTEGAALTLRTRWSALIFYRLRFPVILLILLRVVLITGLLYDLTAFQGDYLRNLTGTIVPDVTLPLAVLLVAMAMTASLLLPVTALGFSAALGLLVSTFVKQRTYIVLTQIVLAAIRVTIVAALVIMVEQFRVDALAVDDVVLWLILFGFAALGDWGISFLYIGFFGAQVWAQVPYGILLGLALMIYVLVQAVLTDFILSYAIRRAERID
jgi:hypothetical protein